MADLTLIIFLLEEDNILPPMRQYRTVWDQGLEAQLTVKLGEEEPTPTHSGLRSPSDHPNSDAGICGRDPLFLSPV